MGVFDFKILLHTWMTLALGASLAGRYGLTRRINHLAQVVVRMLVVPAIAATAAYFVQQLQPNCSTHARVLNSAGSIVVETCRVATLSMELQQFSRSRSDISAL